MSINMYKCKMMFNVIDLFVLQVEIPESSSTRVAEVNFIKAIKCDPFDQ